MFVVALAVVGGLTRITAMSSFPRLWPIVALVAAACSSGETASVVEGGQTGSASCNNPPDCVCDAVRAAVVLRGVVSEPMADDSRSSAADAAVPLGLPWVNVEVAAVLTPDAELEPGASIQGTFQRGLPCGVGSQDPVPPGTEVLVAFEPLRAGTTGNLYLVEWQETLHLTDEVTLAAKDATILVDLEVCRERFATTEELECDGAF